MEPKINWADFPIFLAVVNEGSLSGAARTLQLSQPTVGRRMNALEEQVGGPLLHKTTNGLRPTPMGERVLEHIRQMDIEAEAITRTTAAEDQVLAGEITISASQGIGDLWLPMALTEFAKAHPKIDIIVDVNFQRANLARREADIALRWMGPGNQNSLIGRKVIATGFGLYASTQYLEQFGEPKTLQDLGQHQAVSIRIDEDSPLWPMNLEAIATAPKRIAFRSNSFHSQQTAITCGYGIGSLAHVQAINLPGVVRVLPQYDYTEDLWIVAHDDLARNKRIRLVFDFLIEALHRDREYFETGKPNPWHLQIQPVLTPAEK